MDIQREIIKSIEIMMKDSNHSPTTSSDVLAVILEIKDKKYRVQIYGVDRWVINGIGVDLKVGDKVWVRIPNGVVHQSFIEAKIS